MTIRPVVAGLAVGAVLAAGGISALNLATTDADAQGGGPVSQAQLRKLEAKVTGVGQNSSAAQRISKNFQNVFGKDVVPRDTLIGAEQPPGVIRQDRGVGGGLPEEVLSAEVRAIRRGRAQVESRPPDRAAHARNGLGAPPTQAGPSARSD